VPGRGVQTAKSPVRLAHRRYIQEVAQTVKEPQGELLLMYILVSFCFLVVLVLLGARQPLLSTENALYLLGALPSAAKFRKWPWQERNPQVRASLSVYRGFLSCLRVLVLLDGVNRRAPQNISAHLRRSQPGLFARVLGRYKGIG
jgi:hypothetical protein